MPCDSSHMEANDIEREASKMVAILEELDGKGQPDPKSYGDGCHKKVYNKATRKTLDELTRTLCARLREMAVWQIVNLSLEAQMWWRDHQKSDMHKRRNRK